MSEGVNEKVSEGVSGGESELTETSRIILSVNAHSIQSWRAAAWRASRAAEGPQVPSAGAQNGVGVDARASPFMSSHGLRRERGSLEAEPLIRWRRD